MLALLLSRYGEDSRSEDTYHWKDGYCSQIPEEGVPTPSEPPGKHQDNVQAEVVKGR